MPGRVPSLIVILALAGACRSAERAGSTVQVERDTIGDTSVVSTISGSIWGTEGRLEEELRIGLAEGAEEYVFGDVVELVPDGSGGVYIFDRQGPVLRHYDGTGRFMKTLGRQGGGPGEYRAIVGMGVRRDGRLMVHDAQNRRIAFYAPDGSPSGHWPVNSGLFIDRSLLVDSLDHTYIKAVTIERPGDPAAPPWPIGLIHLDAEGRVVDTLYPPRIAGEPKSTGGPLAVAKTWELHPYGTVVGINRSYVFEIRRPNGTVTRIVRRHEPIPVSEGEWEAHEARRRWEIADEGLSPEHAEETPRTKPAYRSFHVAQDGRIWVRKYMPSVPIPVDGEVRQGGPPPFPFMEPAGFDVFEPDGDYLGHVGVPPRTTIHWFGTDLLYGIRRGENDEQYVVRLRLKTAT
ncbi:MAG: hypothetical protein HOP28_02085 [Gemmatimonadales bacterium]|nr:hypothetical protein [Gemmatimonadales bacterium]